MTSDAKPNAKDIIQSAKLSMQEQARALISLAETLDNEFVKAVHCILNTKGRLVISGMGKSGHIGKKIAASLASTGTRAFFMHPGEAFHGDLGMVAPEDVVLLISNSGESDEILKLIHPLKRFGNQIIGMHGNIESTLGKNSDVNLIVKVNKESCPHNLAPTTSALAALAMGDALTVALMKERSFEPSDFAQYHPGGALGRRLLTLVKDEMKTISIPFVKLTDTVKDCLFIMTQCKSGIAVVESENKLLGVLTDGDIRRAFLSNGNILLEPVLTYMTKKPIFVYEDMKVSEAEKYMQKEKINSLIVKNRQEKVVGIFEITSVEGAAC